MRCASYAGVNVTDAGVVLAGDDMKLGKWDFCWACEWKEWFRFRRMNWVNFHVINFAFEAGVYKGGYCEIELALLGFIVCIEWHDPTSRSVFLAEMDQRIAAANDGSVREL